MRRIAKFAAPVGCALMLIGFLIKAAAAALGWRFALHNPAPANGALTAVLIIAAVAPPPEDRAGRISAAALAPLAGANALLRIFSGGGLAMIFALISFVCSCVVLHRARIVRGIRIAISVLAALMALPMAPLATVSLMFAQIEFGAWTVVRSLESPDGALVAEVIDADAGATGGSTLVEIRRAGGPIDLLIGEITKPPKRVYQSKWGIGDELDLRWQDGRTLLIDGNAYAAGD